MATTNGVYEAMFLLGPIGATEPEASLNICRKIIERHGGQIIVIKKWDERKLAYEIGGQKRGTYILSFFRAPGGAIASIERDVKLSEEVLRVMVLTAEHLNETEMAAAEPQPIVPREERTYGGDRNSWDRPRGPRREEGQPAGHPAPEQPAAK